MLEQDNFNLRQPEVTSTLRMNLYAWCVYKLKRERQGEREKKEMAFKQIKYRSECQSLLHF